MHKIMLLSAALVLLSSIPAAARGPSAVAHSAEMGIETGRTLNEMFENTGHEWCQTPGFEPRSARDFSATICPEEVAPQPHRRAHR